MSYSVGLLNENKNIFVNKKINHNVISGYIKGLHMTKNYKK